MADGPTISALLGKGSGFRDDASCYSGDGNKSSQPAPGFNYFDGISLIPVYAYGYDSFCRDAAEAGVDGVLSGGYAAGRIARA